MHFHLPKPLHGWREFAGEVGIIVLGVMIALGAEQVIDAARWREKVDISTTAIHSELNDQLDYSDEATRLGKCAGPFVDALEGAIIRHDRSAIGMLHDIQPPFEPRPWRANSWESAMSTQVADHIPPAELSRDAFMFSSFKDILGVQNSIIESFAAATTGRIGGPADPVSTSLQLTASEKLRTELEIQDDIAVTMIDTAAGHYRQWEPFHRQPSAKVHARIKSESALCEKTVKSASEGKR